jgi:predicted transcriptional regulator
MSLKQAQELKALKTRSVKLDSEYKELMKDVTELDRRRERIEKQRKELKAKIKQMEASDNIVVTEHAILRYLERIMNIDIEELRAEILTDKTRQQIKTLGNGRYPLEKGGKAVVKNNSIVSVI